MSVYRLRIKKDRLGFSSAHFTLFPDGCAERLHGHNYRTELVVEGSTLTSGLLVDFCEIKDAAQVICSELDERMLIPMQQPALDVRQEGDGVEVRFGPKLYRFPAEDVCLLPLVNTTVEELARHFCNRILEILGDHLRKAGVTRMEIYVEESPGQGGSFETTL